MCRPLTFCSTVAGNDRHCNGHGFSGQISSVLRRVAPHSCIFACDMQRDMHFCMQVAKVPELALA